MDVKEKTNKLSNKETEKVSGGSFEFKPLVSENYIITKITDNSKQITVNKKYSGLPTVQSDGTAKCSCGKTLDDHGLVSSFKCTYGGGYHTYVHEYYCSKCLRTFTKDNNGNWSEN